MESVARNRSRSPRALESEPGNASRREKALDALKVQFEIMRKRIECLDAVIDSKNQTIEAKSKTLSVLKCHNGDLELQLYSKNEELDTAKDEIRLLRRQLERTQPLGSFSDELSRLATDVLFFRGTPH